MQFWGAWKKNERGAALVEFALLMPLLVLLLLGIVEFGWLFGQFNDVRHGAREGARYAAVDGGTSAQIRTYVCNSMDGLSEGLGTIQIALDNGGGNRGQIGSITVRAMPTSLSGAGFITSFLPAHLESEISFRLEQDAGWSSHGLTGVTC